MLDIHQVGRLIGGDRKPVSRTTVWRMVRAKTFPEPVRVSASTVRWREADIEQWLAERPTGLARMAEKVKDKIREAKARRSRKGDSA